MGGDNDFALLVILLDKLKERLSRNENVWSSRLETGSSIKKWLDCLSAHPSTSNSARKKHQTNMRSSPLEIFIGGCATSGFWFGIKNEIELDPLLRVVFMQPELKTELGLICIQIYLGHCPR